MNFKFKKFTALTLSAVMALSMVACGSEDVKEPVNTQEPSPVVFNPTYTVEDLNKAMPEKFVYDMKAETYGMKFGTDGVNSLMGITGQLEGQDVVFELYQMGEDGVYTVLKAGEEAGYSHAEATDELNETVATEDMDVTAMFDTATEVEYLETVDYEGTKYDVVKVVMEEVVEEETEDETLEVEVEGTITVDGEEVDLTDVEEPTKQEGKVYINVETKVIEYFFMTDEATGEEMEIKVTPIEKIELPAEFETETVEEVTAEDIGMQLFAAVFIPLAGAMEGMETVDMAA